MLLPAESVHKCCRSVEFDMKVRDVSFSFISVLELPQLSICLPRRSKQVSFDSGQYKMQTADCRLGLKCRLGTKCRLQTAD